jgi:hypothetical protein
MSVLKTLESALRESPAATLTLLGMTFVGVYFLLMPLDRGPNDARLAAQDLAKIAASARDCGIPEKSIARFASERLKVIDRSYPETRFSEIAAEFAESSIAIARTGLPRSSVVECEKLRRLVAEPEQAADGIN